MLVCYVVVTYGVGGEALEAMGRNATLTGRTSIWQAVLSFVERPMIGFGYENFWMGERLNALRRMGGNSAHNGYLEIYLNLGWIGVGLLTAIILTGYRNMIGRHPDQAGVDPAESGVLSHLRDLQFHGGGIQDDVPRLAHVPSGHDGFSETGDL